MKKEMLSLMLVSTLLLNGVGCAWSESGTSEPADAVATLRDVPVSGEDVENESVGEADQQFVFLPAIIAALVTAGIGGAVAYGIAYKGWQQASPPPVACPPCPPPSCPPPDAPPSGWMSFPLVRRSP